MNHRLAVLASGAAAVLPFAEAAFAQHPVLVFGGGYARECYDVVKARDLASKAIDICNIALEQEDLSRTNRAATLVNRGIVFMREENYERARKDYDRALAIIPDMPETKINLGAMLYHMGRFQEAVEALNAGVTVKDDEMRAAAFYNRAISHEQLGDIQRAYDDYRAALAVIPGYPPAERQLKRYRVQPSR